jgi:hypothetical protein
MPNRDLHTVYVYLNDEAVDCWRPTLAERVSEDAYKLLPTEGYDPDNENWEFKPGSIVECRFSELGNEAEPRMCLVAFRRASYESIE